MLLTMRKQWWMLVVRGVFAILFGVLALVTPGITLAALIFLFGAYVIVDGIGSLYTAWSSRSTHSQWWVSALEGVAGIIAGILAFVLPGMTALVLLYVIAFWAVMTGIIQIIGAFYLRKEMDNEFWLGLTGILSIVFGVALAINPGSGALALIWMIGAYAIAFGVLMILFGFRLKGMSDKDIKSVMRRRRIMDV